MNKTSWTIIIALAITGSLLQLFLYDSLASSNEALTIGVQKISSSVSDEIFGLIGDYLLELMLVLVMIDFLVIERERGFYASTLCFASVALTGTFKSLYVQPRPYWTSSEISPISCSTEWGTPSGHMFLAGSLCTFYMLFTESIAVRSSYVAVLLVVGFDRIYLGVHSYSQVILGLLYALILAHMVYYAYKQLFVHRNYSIYVSSLGVFIYSVFSVLLYVLKDPHFEPKWIENHSQACDTNLDADSAMWDDLMCENFIFMSYGIYLGYYLFTDKNQPPFSWLPTLITVFLLLVTVVTFAISNMVIQSRERDWVNFFGSSLLNLVVGFVSGFCLPYVYSCFSHNYSPLSLTEFKI